MNDSTKPINFTQTIKNEIVLSRSFKFNFSYDEFIYKILPRIKDELTDSFPRNLFHKKAIKYPYFYLEYKPNMNIEMVKKYKYVGLSLNKNKFSELLTSEAQKRLNLFYSEIDYLLNYFNLDQQINLNILKKIHRDYDFSRYKIQDKYLAKCFIESGFNDASINNVLRKLNNLKEFIMTAFFDKEIHDALYNFMLLFHNVFHVEDGNVVINTYSSLKINNITYIGKFKKSISSLESACTKIENETYNQLLIDNIILKSKYMLKLAKIIEINLIDSLNYAYLILEDSNYCNFVISFNRDNKIQLKDTEHLEEKERRDLIYLCKFFVSNLSLYKFYFYLIDFNKYFHIQDYNSYPNNFYNHKKIAIFSTIKNNNISKTIYCNFGYNLSTIKNIKSILNYNLLKKIQFVYNFYTSYIVRYKILNNDVQLYEISKILSLKQEKNFIFEKDNDVIYRMAMPYRIDPNKYQIKNLHKNDNNVLFAYNDTTVFGYINPINMLINNEFCPINDILNPQGKYASDSEFNAIISTDIYLKAFIETHIEFRNLISETSNKKSLFTRLMYIYQLLKYYNNREVMHSSNSIYSSDEKNSLYFKLVNASHIHDEEQDTEMLYKNLWQEANVITGKIFTMIGIILSFIGTLFTIYAFIFDKDMDVTILGCIIPFILLLLFIFIEVWLNREKKLK